MHWVHGTIVQTAVISNRGRTEKTNKMKLSLFLNMAFSLFFVVFTDTSPWQTKSLGPNDVPPSNCQSMMPLYYDAPPQTSPPPYEIRVSKNRASPGEIINVFVSGRAETNFRSFYMQARILGSGPEAVGTFPPENLQVNDAIKISSCPPGTQNSISYGSQVPVNKLQLKWRAPDNFSGKIYFRAMILQSFSIFWVNVASISIEISVSPVEVSSAA